MEVKVKVAGNDNVGIGPYGSYNRKKEEMKFGAQGSVGAGGEVPGVGGKAKAEIGGKVSIGMKGITRDEAFEALREGPGYWNDPAELQQGKSWNDLSKETRERYASHYGWTEKEWQSKVSNYRPNAG